MDLEAVGVAFIAGYNTALATSLEDLANLVEKLANRWRGFFIEGAAMSISINDAIPFTDRRLPEFLQVFESKYVYLTHVGVGWGMARVPWRAKSIGAALDGLLGPLAYDGCGFHDTYFKSRRILGGYRRFRSGYASRAYDQGVGRALWFVTGALPDKVACAIEQFGKERQSDLWAGVGLAATYTGTATVEECHELLRASSGARLALAQGAAFAAEARLRAGCVPANTVSACSTLTGLDVSTASALVREIRVQIDASHGPDLPPYESWRHDVAKAIAERVGLSQ